VDGMGDLDNDAIPDLVVGADSDDDGGTDRGALYILFLNSDGTVKLFQKISDTEGGFEGILDDGDDFGHRVLRLDDYNGDGVDDLFVGAFRDDDGGNNRGATWILFLKKTGEIFIPVGGELIPLDTTSLLVAGTQMTAAWLIPVIVAAIGIGIVIARKF